MKTPGQMMAIAIKNLLLPEIRRLGFGGSGVANFARSSDAYRDFLSIQYWTYGGSFILEFSRVPATWVDPDTGEMPKRAFETDPLLRKRLIDTEQRKDFRGFRSRRSVASKTNTTSWRRRLWRCCRRLRLGSRAGLKGRIFTEIRSRLPVLLAGCAA
ncbi:MAG: hypothetical protein ACN6RK_16655 [Stenotrophomonas sp.]